MGLFDFAKNVGNKIFGDEAEAPEKIQAHIEEDNPGIEGFKVSVKDGIAKLFGKASSTEAAEKAVLMVGNLEGIEKVEVAELVQPEEKADVDYYEIVSGDTLSKIAKKYYGDASQYSMIFEANREVIKNPDLIFVGQKIRIPITDIVTA